MKLVFLSLLVAGLSGSWASAKERVELKPAFDMTQAGTVEYSFELIDTTNGKSISDAQLAVNMEKNLHMIVYDPSLKEFQHVHPIFDGKIWKVQMKIKMKWKKRRRMWRR